MVLMCFILIGGNDMNLKEFHRKIKKMKNESLIDEIAWRALMRDPKDVYHDWLKDLDGLNNVEELIGLFDELNDKLNRSIDNNMADMYKDDFMEKLKIEKLL